MPGNCRHALSVHELGIFQCVPLLVIDEIPSPSDAVHYLRRLELPLQFALWFEVQRMGVLRRGKAIQIRPPLRVRVGRLNEQGGGQQDVLRALTYLAFDVLDARRLNHGVLKEFCCICRGQQKRNWDGRNLLVVWDSRL